MIQAPPFFHVACPSCATEFPIDPEKVPDAGVHAICSTCQRVFLVEAPEAPETPVSEAAEASPAAVVDEAPVIDEDLTADEDFEIGEAPAVDDAAVEGEGEVDLVATSEPEETTTDSAAEEPGFEDLSTLTSEAMADEDLDQQLAGSALSLAADKFGKRDPSERARRLARVLVSDIIAYYPARYRESLGRGTVKEDFEDEVKKSWKEYVDQVGLDVAESTPHFEDALNEILGKGEKIF